MLLNHSAAGLHRQLPHHVPRPRHHRHGDMDTGVTVHVLPHVRRLHPHDLQTTSDEQEGFLHGE